MKRILLTGILGSAFIVACNNSGNNITSAADSATHSTAGHDNGTTTSSGNNTNTSNVGSNVSMMDLMNKNMQDMKAVQSTGNPDNDFAALMKVHHMGAIEMAQVVMAQGTDPQIKQIAQKIIDEQQREIAELNTFLSGHQAHGGGESFYKEVMSQMNNMKMDMDHSGSIDRQFAQMMIPHHQGAIDMAKAYLKSGAHEEKLKAMANKIIADQQKEIREFQAWLNKNP
ncbi:MAG TPA: DUF305 domain-containing protein [Flavisolibacter sp.]|nr:DUF305 domain-containing protein [Flavisolibacter sp.]